MLEAMKTSLRIDSVEGTVDARSVERVDTLLLFVMSIGFLGHLHSTKEVL